MSDQTNSSLPKFESKEALLPAIIQHVKSGQVLMLGYMNQEAFETTKKNGKVTFFSRSKNRLWEKGETSGNTLKFVSAAVDCDRDAILIKAEPMGPVCHTGSDTCFGEKFESADFLASLAATIKSRKAAGDEKSYVARLFESGIAKIAQKVGEEATETVIEAMKTDDSLFNEEAADLLFHLMVLLEAKGSSLNDVVSVLAKRNKTK